MLKTALRAAFAVALTTSPCLAAESDRSPYEWSPLIGASIATEHVGAERDFNETNPGVFIGVSRLSESLGDAELGLETGIFENSFSELSATFNVWSEWTVLNSDDGFPGAFRLGAAVGIARYANLVDEARDAGLPTFGDFVPFAALQATWAFNERIETRLRIAPIGGDADFVAGLQIFYRPFG